MAARADEILEELVTLSIEIRNTDRAEKEKRKSLNEKRETVSDSVYRKLADLGKEAVPLYRKRAIECAERLVAVVNEKGSEGILM